MRNLWSKYLALLDADLSAKIFDNIKNLLVCALLFAAGTNALQGDREACLEAGMNDYLAKPFKRADLQRILLRWLPARP